MGLATNDILLSKTTRPLIFCATHQLEDFIKQGYRAEEAAQELESRRTQRAPDFADAQRKNYKMPRMSPSIHNIHCAPAKRVTQTVVPLALL